MRVCLHYYCLLFTTLLLLACGNEGVKINDGQQLGQAGTADPAPFVFINGGPSVQLHGVNDISVTAVTNRAAAEIAYIVLAAENPPPNLSDYFTYNRFNNRFNNRFSFTAPVANRLAVDGNNENLNSDTKFNVYVAAKSAGEVIVTDTPFKIVTGHTIIEMAWQQHCGFAARANVIEGDVYINNPDDLAVLNDIQVIDGKLTFVNDNTPEHIDLNSLACVRSLEINDASNIKSLNVSHIKVVESILLKASAPSPIKRIDLDALLAANKIEIVNATVLTDLLVPRLTRLVELRLHRLLALNNLSLPQIRSFSRLRIESSALADFSGMGELNEIDELVLSSLDAFKVDHQQNFHVIEKFKVKNLAKFSNFDGFQFSKLKILSLENVPLDADVIYSGAGFDVAEVSIVATKIQHLNALLLKLQNLSSLKLIDNDSVVDIEFHQVEKLQHFQVSGHRLLERINLPKISEIDQLLISDHGGQKLWGRNEALVAIEFLSLRTVADLVIADNPQLSVFSLPELSEVIEVTGINSRCDFVRNGIKDLTLPMLEMSACRFWIKESVVESIHFPMLKKMVGGGRTFDVGTDSSSSNLHLKVIAMPELVNAKNMFFDFSYNPALETLDMNNLIEVGAINITDNALYEQCAAVDIWQKLGEKGIRPEANRMVTTCL